MSHHRMRGVVEVGRREEHVDGAGCLADVDTYPVRLKRVTLTWVLVALVLFPVLAVLGFVMRVVAGRLLPGACRPNGFMPS